MEDKKKFNKQEYDNAYIRDHKDRLNFVMPKGTKERIQQAAAAAGISSSEWIRRTILEKLGKQQKEKPEEK